MAIDQNKVQKRLGEVIRAKRLEMGLSQEEFATQCGIHRTYMGAVERGERNISLLNIVRIANGLKVKPSELFNAAKL